MSDKNFTFRQNPIRDEDLAAFVERSQPGKLIGKRMEPERFQRFALASDEAEVRNP